METVEQIKYWCNECGFETIDSWENKKNYYFCPICGHVNTQASFHISLFRKDTKSCVIYHND